MQEETKSTASKKSFETNRSFHKNQKKNNQSWSLECILNCCRTQNPENDPIYHNFEKKVANSSVATHYSNRGPSSFANISRNHGNSNSILNVPDNAFPMDTPFLLGRGSNKIISKISRVNLVLKTSNASDKWNESEHSRPVHEANPGIQSDLKASENIEIMDEENKDTRKARDRYNFTRYQIFSLYSQGIQVEKSDWNEITPEIIAQYIAKKFEGQITIDALSGYGGNTIQFAKHCQYVIGVEIEGYKIKKAKHNSGIYQVNNRIDFIHADFFSLQKLEADVVFLAPSEVLLESSKTFSLTKNLFPDLPKLIRHSLNIANSVCILLPSVTDIEEVALIFCNIFNENPNQYKTFNYTLQIDLIYVEQSFISTLIHFGGKNSITTEEQRDVLFSTINLNENPSWRALYPQTFVNRLLSYVGIQRSLMIISSIEEELYSENRIEDNVFDVFLDSLKEKKVITPEVLQQLHQSYGDRDSRAYSPGDWNMSSYNNDGRFVIRNGSIESNSKKLSFPNKNLINGHSYQNSDKGLRVQETPSSGDEFTSNSKVDNQKNSSGKGDQIHTEFDLKEMNAGSLETSEIAVSSYSMKSAALLDSDSDNGAQYTLSLDSDNIYKGTSTKEIDNCSGSKGVSGKTNFPTKRDKSSLVETNREKVSNTHSNRPVSGSYSTQRSQRSKNF